MTDGNTYSYYVVAYDAARNVSDASNTVSATPADTTAPTAPSNLTASAGNARISLTWGVSTDPDNGVQGYDVYRNGLRIAQTSSTSYTDAAVSDGTTYTYDVVAYDLASNMSQPSNTASATSSASPDNNVTSSLSTALGFRNLALDDEFTGSAGSLPSTSLWSAKSFSGGSGSSAYFNGWNDISLDGTGDLDIKAVRTTNSSGQTVWDTGWIESNVGVTSPLLYEVRAKVPGIYGMWSAPGWSWHYPYGTTCGGEVDDVEQLGRQPYNVNNSVHWCDSSSTAHSLTKLASTPYVLANDFHIYSAAIYSDHVDYYIDGVLYNTISSSETSGFWPFIEPTSFNISLNVGSCGSWADCPASTAPSTTEMLVDWIRVYTP